MTAEDGIELVQCVAHTLLAIVLGAPHLHRWYVQRRDFARAKVVRR